MEAADARGTVLATSMFGLVLRDTSERCFWDSPGTLSYTMHTILLLVFMTLRDVVAASILQVVDKPSTLIAQTFGFILRSTTLPPVRLQAVLVPKVREGGDGEHHHTH